MFPPIFGLLRLGGDSSRNGLIQRIKLYRYR